MMPAAKHFDPVLGVDIHIVQPPGPVPPLPVPHPFVGFIIDPFDYVPIFGATVKVNGVPRAQAGTNGKAVPSHIPIGGVFVKPPANECEMFMGSSTVSVDGDAFSYLALPALSCQDIGIPPIPRINPKKKSKIKSLVLPTSIVLPIPAGPPVLIGGAPTISLMVLGMKLGFAALGRGLRRLARTRFARNLMRRAQRFRQRLFRRLPPGFLKCNILRAEPVNITTGEIVVQQQDFSLNWPLGLSWTRCYSSQSSRSGLCGFGWESPGDARLVIESEGVAIFYDGTSGSTLFPALPEHGPVYEFVDGAALHRSHGGLQVRLKSGLIYHFDTSNHQAEYLVQHIADGFGNRLSFRRKAGSLHEIVSNAGPCLEVVNRDGRIHKFILHHPLEAEPRTLVRYEYDKEGDLREVYDALQHPCRLFYRNHCLVRHTDRNGLSFYYELDNYTVEGRVLRAWGDGGLYNYHFKYELDVGLVHIINSLGHASVIEVNGLGLPISETDPLDGITRFEYDDAGRTVAVVDPIGMRTEYLYDHLGNLLKLTSPDGSSRRINYNERSNAINITDPMGAEWKQQWNSMGQLIGQISPLSAETRYEYNIKGQLVAFTNPRGTRTEFGFDNYGNLVTVSGMQGGSIKFQYDALGNVTKKTDELGICTCYTYDDKGRIVKTKMPSGVVLEYEYDATDNLTKYCDENGEVSELEYVGIGQIKRRRQPDGHSVEYYYDSEERLVKLINQNGESYELRRDELGRVVEEIDYWGQPRRYSYSASGVLRESVDSLGRRTRYETDPMGRIVKKLLLTSNNAPATRVEAFEYNANGNLIACENSSVRIERKLDAEGRLVEERQGNICIINNDYDATGSRICRATTLIVDSHQCRSIVRYRYNSFGQPISIEIDGRETLQLTRDPMGRVVLEKFGPQIARTREYGDDGELTVQEISASGAPLRQTYDYDKAGNLTRRNDSVFGVDLYSYDPVGRICSHLSPQHGLSYHLNDPLGNRLSTQVQQSAPKNGLEADWRRTGSHEGIHYQFDRVGNLVGRIGQKIETVFTWDPNQRLVQSITNGRTTAYTYDALGRRICKSTDDLMVFFIWDGDALLGDIQIQKDLNAVKTRKSREWIYYPQSFEPAAMIEAELMSIAAQDSRSERAMYLYHNDPNGCPTRLLDLKGNVVWAALYGPWGTVEELAVNQVENPLRLIGQYEDRDSGLYYNRYRYYDPQGGQFVSQDPLGLQVGENVYRFAPNTLVWTDALGLVCVHRFHTAGDPSTLLPNLSRASRLRQAWVNFLMRFRPYREWRAHLHMRGDTRFSPFVSVVTDHNALANSTDPWARTITTGSPGLPGVSRAPDLSTFDVPPERLIAPQPSNALSIAETEMVSWGDDLASSSTGTIPNPY